MNKLTCFGRVIGITPGSTKNGKRITEVVLESETRRKIGASVETKSVQIMVRCFGFSAEDAERLQHGELVFIEANVDSHEYGGKWYTDATCERISKVNIPATRLVPEKPLELQMQGKAKEDDGDVPF